MRLALVLAGLVLAGGGVEAALEHADVSFRRIETFSARPIEGMRLGFLGGLVLHGPRKLGGVSGLLVEDEDFLAVTDSGSWVTGRLLLDGERLVGVEDVSLAPRIDTDGKPITTKTRGDAEALAAAPGTMYVLVESTRELLAYPADGLTVDTEATPQKVALSAEERRVGAAGWESLAIRPDGTLLAIAEGRDGNAKQTPAFLLGKRRFAFARRDGYAITDAAMLPGGDMILLERRYLGGLDVSMRVRRIGADALNGKGLADGPVLLEADFSAEIDNMEALAAEVRDGEIVLTLASDDNHSFWQRTLMLRFRVTDPLPRPKPELTAAAIH